MSENVLKRRTTHSPHTHMGNGFIDRTNLVPIKIPCEFFNTFNGRIRINWIEALWFIKTQKNVIIAAFICIVNYWKIVDDVRQALKAFIECGSVVVNLKFDLVCR